MTAPRMPVRPKRNRRLDRLPARGAQRVSGFALRGGHGLQDLPCDRGGERDDHDGEDQPGREHAHAQGRSGEEGKPPRPRRRQHFQLSDDGNEDEDAPEAIDDRRNRGQQLGQKRERRAERARRELREKDRDPERDGRREEHRQEGRVQRAPDERQRAELPRDRVPGLPGPEPKAELRDRELRRPERARRRCRRRAGPPGGRRTPSPGGSRGRRRSDARRRSRARS